MTIRGELIIRSEKVEIVCPTGESVEKNVEGFNLQVIDFGKTKQVVGLDEELAGEVSLEGSYFPEPAKKASSYFPVYEGGGIDFSFFPDGDHYIKLKLNHEATL